MADPIIPSTTEGSPTLDASLQTALETPPVAPVRVPATSLMDLNEGETPASVIDGETAKIKDRAKLTNLPPRDDRGRFKTPEEKAAEKAENERKKAAPAAPATPAAKPAAVPDPVKAAEAAKAATPPADDKITIGGKAYTKAELEAALAAKEKPAPTPAPAAPAAKPDGAPAGPTPEQIREANARFVADISEKIDFDIPEAQLETILVGGKEGAAALKGLLKQVAAHAVLSTRAQVAEELNPHLANIYGRLDPLVSGSVELEKVATEQAFVAQYPDLAEAGLEDARWVAEQLVEKYPEQVRQMSRADFIAEVARQTDQLKETEFKRWNPKFQGTWRDWFKAQKEPPPAPAAIPTPAPTPAPAPEPPKPAVRPKPPAANPPSSGGGFRSPDWQKATASSLRD